MLKKFVLNNQFHSVFIEDNFRRPKLTLPLSPEMPEIKIDIEDVSD